MRNYLLIFKWLKVCHLCNVKLSGQYIMFSIMRYDLCELGVSESDVYAYW